MNLNNVMPFTTIHYIYNINIELNDDKVNVDPNHNLSFWVSQPRTCNVIVVCHSLIMMYISGGGGGGGHWRKF